jgi:hypothetical protein
MLCVVQEMMATGKTSNYGLNIEVSAEDHRRIKIYAAMKDETVRSYVLNAVQSRMREDSDFEMIQAMTAAQDPVLGELWDNEKDAAYDGI